MQLVEVKNPKLAKKFMEVNPLMQKGNTEYVRPLDKDVNEVFDKEKNKAFRNGECIRWILEDENGNSIGRIAAFTNKKYKNKGDEVSVGGMGFFDCINNQTAANLLLDTAKKWLIDKGMQAMDGPINFGERDRWWGLVVKGFQSPYYCMNYNPPYYKDLLENFGFQLFFKQICFGLDPKKPLREKVYQRHALVAQDPAYSARHIKKDQLEKYAADFTTIYNKAWAGHGGLKELKLAQVNTMFKKMKLVMDEKIIWFAYHKEDPIAMFVNLPDLNQWFKSLNGKFGLLQKLYFLWLKKTRPNKNFAGIVFGLIPEFQGKGVDSYIIVESAKVIQPHTAYTEYEMQWIGDFNPKMLNIAEQLGETFHSRELITYRYLFNRSAQFKRHPILS
jgi:hypothetical protein